MFKFFDKCKRLEDHSDPKHVANLYLLKIIQQHVFSREAEYLKYHHNKDIPDLVRNLNLFRNDGILRADGKICSYPRI